MLFEAKINALFLQITYLESELKSLLTKTTYTAKKQRLEIQLDNVRLMRQILQDVSKRLKRYSPPDNPALDTFPQLFSEFREISHIIHRFRVNELPLYQAESSDDIIVANLLDQLLVETGLQSIKSVVSLHQAEWFAVLKIPVDYPMFLLPNEVINNPFEIPLFFHEIGHILFAFYPDLGISFEAVLNRIFISKNQKAQEIADPKERLAFQVELNEWKISVVKEIEETVCDIIGNLLGGPSFSIVSLISLLTADKNIFESGYGYPPLDLRMRINLDFLSRHKYLEPNTLEEIKDKWELVQANHRVDKPRWYDHLYDQSYLDDIIATAEGELRRKQLTLYKDDISELRNQLFDGVHLVLENDIEKYESWSKNFTDSLKKI